MALLSIDGHAVAFRDAAAGATARSSLRTRLYRFARPAESAALSSTGGHS
jgi:hypothetical protein